MSARNDAEPGANPGAEAPATGNLLADLRGSGAESGPMMPDGRIAKAPPKVSAQTVVILIVLAVSAGALYLMRRQGMGAGMRFQTVKIEHDFDKPMATTPAQQRILDDLARSGAPMQVPIENLPKNPFALTSAPGDFPTGDPDADARRQAEFNRTQREKRDKELSGALSALVLNSVMDGPVPIARVNGQIVKIGDTVGDFFTVSAIHGRGIEVTVDGLTYAVEMGGETPRPSGGQPRGR